MATPCEALQFPSKKRSTPIPPAGKNKAPALSVALAGSQSEIRQCQRLRYRIFADEMGASLDTPTPGIDQDSFDPLSRHLLVRDSRSGEIVGTTRLLIDSNPDYDARYYLETEFDLQNVLELPGQAYCPAQPLAIRYRQDGAHDEIAPYTGDDLFITHLWRILARRETCVELCFLPPLSSYTHRRELAAECRAHIVTELNRKAMPVIKPAAACAAEIVPAAGNDLHAGRRMRPAPPRQITAGRYGWRETRGNPSSPAGVSR